MADNQCNKVLKKNNLRLGIEFLVSSDALDQTMGDNCPKMTISMMTKMTLPIG